MVSTEMIEYLISQQDLLEAAYNERAKGNFYGAGWLARQYEKNIQDELEFWNIDYNYAVNLGLVIDDIGF